MNSKKGLKYYGMIFLFSTAALVLYIAYLAYSDDSFDFNVVYSYLFVPPMFTLFLFAFDRIFDAIFPSKTKKGNAEYKAYLKHVGEAISKECDFGIEGYRRLRESYSFQKSLEQGFRILSNGETEDFSFQFLEKKFDKGTNEYIALEIVIEEVKKMMESSEKDYQK